jgi:hypothetical protein
MSISVLVEISVKLLKVGEVFDIAVEESVGEFEHRY